MQQRVTITPSDNLVYVDNEAREVDCSTLPTFLHAIQWYGDRSPAYGEIEWNEDAQGRKLPNMRFTDFTPYQYLADAWALVPVPGGPNPNLPPEEPPADAG